MLLALGGSAWADEAPVFSPTGPDAAAYGAAEGYPVGGRAAPIPRVDMVGSYSHFAEKYPSRQVARADSPSVWLRATRELTLDYTYQGQTRDLPDYLSRNPTTGLLIARGDTILYEHYQYGRTDQDRMLSQSMAKTLVAMLVGIAVREGAIRSIDQPAADYVPALAGSEIGKTPIRALLHMASGVAFKEIYDAPGDSQRLSRMLFTRANPGPAQAVAQFDTREEPPDTYFHYAGLDTEALGLVVTQAVKMPLAEYLRTRIWQPMGAEADAAWTIDTTGQEVAYLLPQRRAAGLGQGRHDAGERRRVEWEANRAEAMGAGRHHASGLVSGAWRGNADLRVWVSNLAVARTRAEVRAVGHSWPVDFRRSGIEARAGAYGRAVEAVAGSGGGGVVHAVERFG